MCKGKRLRKDSQFSIVYSQGRTWASNLVVLKALPNNLGWNRYGFVASKRVGKAVVRNRVRRLLREVARAVPAEQGWDIILIARARSAGANYHEIDAAVRGLLLRSGILKEHCISGGGENAEG
jgi:ribonuclease P protein component